MDVALATLSRPVEFAAWAAGVAAELGCVLCIVSAHADDLAGAGQIRHTRESGRGSGA